MGGPGTEWLIILTGREEDMLIRHGGKSVVRGAERHTVIIFSHREHRNNHFGP